jgi:DNA (cytosine-5)-methyltransferase 1
VKLLELFCGAGGTGVGFQRAGFNVTGVDIDAHPDCPFPVVVADACQVLTDTEFIAQFDAIAGGPPCQGYTTMSNRWRGAGGKADQHPDLISWVRLGMQASGLPYVIENVDGARRELRNPTRLRGGMFGLGVDRPRLFETNFPLPMPPANVRIANPVGVYGKHHDGRRLFTRKDGSIQRAARTLAEAQEAMGIDWMVWDDLREAIPPAYSEWVGRQLIAHLRTDVAA